MSIQIGELLQWVDGKIENAEEFDGNLAEERVERPSELKKSKENDLAFFFSKKYQSELVGAAPKVLVTGVPFVASIKNSGLSLWKKTVIVSTQNPYLAMAILSQKFKERMEGMREVAQTVDDSNQIHPSAVVSKKVQLGRNISIGPHVVIEANVKIGDHVRIGAGCTISSDVEIKSHCIFFPGVHVYSNSIIGNHVRIHSGVVIGVDGFGYVPDSKDDGRTVIHEKIIHFGRVRIEDSVEIGANTCIDRGTLGETVVSRGAKIDNLVHIAHNVSIGEGAIICGNVGIAGGAEIGKYAVLGGICGIANRVKIGDYAQIAACSLIAKDVPEKEVFVGNPARNRMEHFRAQAFLNRSVKKMKKK